MGSSQSNPAAMLQNVVKSQQQKQEMIAIKCSVVEKEMQEMQYRWEKKQDEHKAYCVLGKKMTTKSLRNVAEQMGSNVGGGYQRLGSRNTRQARNNVNNQ